MKERSTSSMGLFRFYYVAGSSPLFVSTMIFREKYYHKHPEKYSKEQRFKFAKKIMLHMKNRGRVKTDYYGRENLPKDGGYILYSNHQGKYDAIGILIDQKEPCSVLMERKQGGRVVAKQVLRLTGSETLDLDNPKSQIATLKKVAEEDISSFRRENGATIRIRFRNSMPDVSDVLLIPRHRSYLWR